TRLTGQVAVPVVRVKRGVLVIPIGDAMECIRARTAGYTFLPPARNAKRGVGVGNPNAKLRDGVDIQRKDWPKNESEARIGCDVDAVERYHVLVRARARNRAARRAETVVTVLGDVLHRARLQVE